MVTNTLRGFIIFAFSIGASLFASPVVNLKGTMSVSQGSLNYKLDIEVPKGIAGVKPKLSLIYNSSGTNGYLGKGWSIEGFSTVSRCSDTMDIDNKLRGIKFDSEDHYCLDGKRLIPVEGDDGAVGAEYRTYIESDSKVLSMGGSDGNPNYFMVYTKSGDIYEYGHTTQSKRLIGTARISWQVNKISDRYGNSINFYYETNNVSGYSRPTSITYGNNNAIVFGYEDRKDLFHGYSYGEASSIDKKLTTITLQYHNTTVSTYKLTYKSQASSLDALLLEEIRECNADGECTEPLKFAWEGERAVKQDNIYATSKSTTGAPTYKAHGSQFSDFNGDGITDILYDATDSKTEVTVAFGSGDGSFGNSIILSDSSEHRPELHSRNIQLVDIDQDNDIDILYLADDCAWYRGGGDSYPKCYNNNYTDYTFVLWLNDGEGHFTKESREVIAQNKSAENRIVGMYTTQKNKYSLRIRSIPNYELFEVDSSLNVSRVKEIETKPDYWSELLANIDINGDSVPDKIYASRYYDHYEIWLSRENGDIYKVASYNFGEKTSKITVADLNGDSLSDIYVNHSGGNDDIWWNKGDGTFVKSDTHPPLRASGSEYHKTVMVADFNGDGLGDLYEYKSSGQDYIWLNKGDGNFVKVNKNPGVSVGIGDRYSGNINLVDINGDGYIDILQNNKGASQKAILFHNAPYHITSITDSFENESTIVYSSISDPQVYTKGADATEDKVRTFSSPAVQVVSATVTADGAGNLQKQYYHYEGLRTHKYRGSLGFEYVYMYDATSGVKSSVRYAQEPHITGMILSSDSYLLSKDLDADEWLANSGEKLIESTISYHEEPQTDRSNLRILTDTKIEKSYMENQLLKTTTTGYTDYDEHGNVLEMKSTIEGRGEAFVKITVSSYDNDTDDWILGRLKSATVTHEGYSDIKVRHTSFDYDINTGTLTDEWIEKGSTLELHKHYAYDTHGNKVSESIINGITGETRTTSYHYDSNAEHLLSVTNPLGHTASNEAFDERFGTVTQNKDANGLISYTHYDAWGRNIYAKSPDGTEVSISYALDYTPAHGYYRITSTTILANGTTLPSSAVYYDALGRKLREKSVRYDGAEVFVDYAYDERGRMYQKSSPHTIDETPLYATHSYDKYGREISVSTPAPENIGGYLTATVSYDGYTATSTDAKGGTKTTTKNVMDKIISVTDEAGTTLHYGYDALGNLAYTIPNADEHRKITIEYDILGNKTKMIDPDMGTWTYAYNGWGELTSQTDAKAQTSTMEYDILGRLIHKVTSDGTSTWGYDTATNGLGKLASESHSVESISKSYTYDTLSRPKSVTSVIDGVPYTQSFHYDTSGRLQSTIQPKGLKLIRSYNQYGFLQSIKSPAAQIGGWDSTHFKGLLEGMRGEAFTYATRYKKALLKRRALVLKAKYYQALADKYGTRADRLQAIAQKLNLQAERMRGYELRYETAYRQQQDRIFAYLLLSDRYHGQWVDDGLAQWHSGFFLSLRDQAITLVGAINTDVPIPTTAADEYTNYASNQRALSHEALDKAEVVLKELIKEDEKVSYYTSLDAAAQGGGDVADAYREMIADSSHIYHYRLLQMDSYGRTTKYISGNGLVTEDSYDDGGAMVTSKTGYHGEASIRSLAYAYDERYNLSSREDKFLGITSTYSYDVLSRIEYANMVITGTQVSTGIVQTENLHYSYDDYGNLTYKDGQGDYHYTDTQHPNRLVSTDQRGFTYDDNGNMTHNGNTLLEYNAANKPTSITTDEGVSTFAYDMNDQRYQKTTDESTTTYINKVYEHIQNNTYNFSEDKYFIYAGDRVVALYSQYHGTRYENSIRYLHYDALGSIDAITDAEGAVVERSAYKPFGERIVLHRDPDSRAITNRGFTGHEEVEGTQLIHMNARLYDPTLGRFMSADTLIQDPNDLQSYNRYAYTRNNPLRYTDPSGHSWISVLFGAIIGIFSFGIGTIIAGTLGLGAIGTAVVAGAIAGFIGGFVNGLMNGLGPGDALLSGFKGALFGGVSAVAAMGVADYITGAFGLDGHAISLWVAKSAKSYAAAITKAIMHGVVRGAMSLVQGGKFLANFASGFVSSAFSIGRKTFGEGAVAARTAVMALVGGVTSSLTGGKFLNGAVSAAFVHLFNTESGKSLTERYNALRERVFASALKNKKAILALSKADLIIIAQYKYREGLKDKTDYIGAMEGKADTFLYKGLASRTFIALGRRWKGGQINYIGVGAYNAAYLGTIGWVFTNEFLNIGWNVRQWWNGGGTHNITDIPANDVWMTFGSIYGS